MQRYAPILATLALAFGLSGQAAATSISGIYTGTVAGGMVFRNIDGTGYKLHGGQMRVQVLDSSPGVLPIDDQLIYGWCIEPFETISYIHNYQWEVTNLSAGANNIGGMGETRANFLRELYQFVAPDFTKILSPNAALALQIATWEIVRDDALGAFDLYSGNTWFRKSSPRNAIALAQHWLDTVINDGDQDPMLDNLYAISGDGVQDMVVQINYPRAPQSRRPANAIPVAPSWLLMLPGLLLAYRRRRHHGD